ncbi:MAG: hypothetical protein SFV81_07005 [Pirellulaceae bacterium]|nr:hypothetical protein [Pirellulaceae bacterium]
MNSGSVMKADIKRLTDVEQAVLEHSRVFGITTSDIWDSDPTLKSFGRVAVGGAVRKLTRIGMLLRGTLHYSRYCFVYNPAVNAQMRVRSSPIDPQNESQKLLGYTKLLLHYGSRPDLHPIDPEQFVKHFGNNLRGSANRYMRRIDQPPTLTYLRIDTRVQSRPSRSAQVIRGDILQMVKNQQLASQMRQQKLEYLWVTPTQMRANAVIAHFRKYDRLGKSPISVVVLPQLLPLLTGVLIKKETFSPPTIL